MYIIEAAFLILSHLMMKPSFFRESRVSHTHFCLPCSWLGIDKPNFNFNWAVLWSKFEGIRKEVEENLQITMVVTHHAYEVTEVRFFEHILHPNILLWGLEFKTIESFFNDFMQIKKSSVEMKLGVLHFG